MPRTSAWTCAWHVPITCQQTVAWVARKIEVAGDLRTFLNDQLRGSALLG